LFKSYQNNEGEDAVEVVIAAVGRPSNARDAKKLEKILGDPPLALTVKAVTFTFVAVNVPAGQVDVKTGPP
jgi:hypothetical protein